MIPLSAISSSDVREIEHQFRHMAFHIAYRALYETVEDKTLRFTLALVHSSRPISNPELVAAWWEWTRGLTMKKALQLNRPVPEVLQPIIDGYREAILRRAFEVGDDPHDVEVDEEREELTL